MKVCRHNGLTIAVLSRNEHCPPHVHVGTRHWDARFRFSFWHQGVQLWDVTPAANEPVAATLESLRCVIKSAANLRKARTLWWRSRQTVCLENQQWDMAAEEVVSPKAHRHGAVAITRAWFDDQAYRTVLHLAGPSGCLEIEL